MSTKATPVNVPDSVRIKVREYAIGHPEECSRQLITGYLGREVSLTVANAAIDELAESEERFAGLRQEVQAA